MVKKTYASKSEEKRLTSPRNKAKAAKPKVSISSADSTHTVNEILDRIAVLEKKADIVADGFAWIADQIKPVFGIGGISVYFEAIAKKLAKK